MEENMLNFHKLNIRWLVAGIFLLILGYIILGWTPSGNLSYTEIVFSWHQLNLAPVIILSGYLLIGISIMVRTKK